MITLRHRVVASMHSLGKQIKNATLVFAFRSWAICESKSLCLKRPIVVHACRLGFFFQVWRKVSDPAHGVIGVPRFSFVWGFAGKAIVCLRLFKSCEADRQAVVVENAVRESFLARARDQALEIHSSTMITNRSSMFGRLRTLYKPGKAMVSMSLRDEQGRAASSYQDNRRVLFKHFSSSLQGINTSLQSMHAQDMVKSDFQISEYSKLQLKQEVLPPPSVIRRCHARSKLWKGLSEECIGTEVGATYARQVSKLLAPLAIRCALTTFTPIQWRGGQVQEIFKGKGVLSSPKSYRDVFLASFSGSSWSRFLRSRAQPWAERHALRTQFGSGLFGGGTDLAHLALQGLLDVAAANRLSCAIPFVDLSSAFASMARAVALPMPQYEADLVQTLVSMGFDRREVAAVREIACEDTLGLKEDPQHLVALICSMHSATWMSIEGISDVVETRRGSLAGTSLGDIVFTMSITKVLVSIRKAMAAEGLSTVVSSELAEDLLPSMFAGGENVSAEVGDVSYVDDALFPVICEPSVMQVALSKVMSIVDHEFSVHGFLVNFAAGKTEVMVRWAGKGSKAAAVKLQYDYKEGVPFVGGLGEIKYISIVSCYRHLGTMTTRNGSIMPEIRIRGRAMVGSMSKLRAKFLRAHAVPRNAKSMVVQASLFSTGLFNAGTWPLLYRSEARQLSTYVMKVYRSFIHDPYYDKYMSDVQVMEMAQALSPLSLVMYKRICLLIRVVKKGGNVLWVLLASASRAHRSWWKAISDDVTWLRSKHEFFESSASVDSFAQLCRLRPIKVKQLAYEALLASPLYPTEKVGKRRSNEHDITQTQPRRVVCSVCSEECQNKQLLAMHMFSKHGLRLPIRSKIDSRTCAGCLQRFSSIECVVCHVSEKSRRCRYVYSLLPELDEQVLESVKAAELDRIRSLATRGLRRAATVDPVVRVRGPLTFEADRCGISHKRLLFGPCPEWFRQYRMEDE